MDSVKFFVLILWEHYHNAHDTNSYYFIIKFFNILFSLLGYTE